jgi:hypothetical protein
MDLRAIGWGVMDWIDVAQDRNQCEHGNEPLGAIKCWEVLEFTVQLAASQEGSAPWSYLSSNLERILM